MKKSPIYPVFDFINDFLGNYPESEIRDVYKILYHAYHGAEHYMPPNDDARVWFEKEWNSLDMSKPSGKDLIEPAFIKGITPKLYRLNLVPAKLTGIDPDWIIGEFMRAATEFPAYFPTDDVNLHDAFRYAWSEICTAITEGILKINMNVCGEFNSLINVNNWPAIRHSEKYRSLYIPHYRLVTSLPITG
jgi:hypothetical protein